ncbi:MAG TPA: carboxylesterase family protein, partial [Paludibacter sp.]|nr:carboxylesterase family protein [Paludibacter sp.]
PSHPDYPKNSPEYDQGSPHAQDVSYVFQHLNASDPNTSKSDIIISEAMGDYWINFVKSGNPNGAALPQWTPFNRNNPMVMYFENNPHLAPVPDEKALEVLDRYFKWRISPESKK